MEAKETKLQDIIEGTKQYVIPLFQRTYSWTEKEWDILWKDIVEISEMENPRTHFIGSIVNMPTVSVPEGVAKFLLIDGQQRITTIFIILVLLRNRAIESGKQRFAEEINNTLLVNQYKDGIDYYKLLPTQIDRTHFQALINKQSGDETSQIIKAYNYFEKKIKQSAFDSEKIKKIITANFSIVSIVLDANDNPYLVFESLNAKGRPLTQADLIRNFFFMRIHIDEQEAIYNRYWNPMQTQLGEKLTEFIRHFLMKDGSIIKQNDVYYTLKEKVSAQNATEYLSLLLQYSKYYNKFLNPSLESDLLIQKYLKRLNRIEVTTAYPFLLNIYNAYEEKKINKADFVEILKTIENYLIRRFVCNVPTNQLNKIFPPLYSQIKNNSSMPEELKSILQRKGYPRDSEFINRFKDAKFYGAGDRQIKTKLILESIEESFQHRETVSFDDLTIEHIMPQTLSQWWQNHLGDEWEETHELYLHTIGNLTLTAYNTQLSNDDFSQKKNIYESSHLSINKYFENATDWKKENIEKRADELSKLAIGIWPYFGQQESTGPSNNIKGTVPKSLIILGQRFEVESWRDVLENTLNTIANRDIDKFNIIASKFPRLLGKDRSKFRAIRQLQNEYFVEVNLSSQSIQKFCNQAIEECELSFDDWKLEF
jgi:uncharacterized protein with ParB-like and HNH nuclease domain